MRLSLMVPMLGSRYRSVLRVNSAVPKALMIIGKELINGYNRPLKINLKPSDCMDSVVSYRMPIARVSICMRIFKVSSG